MGNYDHINNVNHNLQPTYHYGNGSIAVDRRGYLVWKTSAGRTSKNRLHTTWRDWRLVKFADGVERLGDIGTIGRLRLPERYIGKRIRIKFEIVKDEEPIENDEQE